MVDIWRQSVGQSGPTTDHRAPIVAPPRAVTLIKVLTAAAAAIVTIATATIGGKMKVSELKEGMLLRFKQPRVYKYLRDSGDDFWLDCGALDPKITLRWTQTGQPLMIYLGQEEMEAPSHYGGYMNIRKVSVEGREAWMWPDAWRYVETL